MGYITIIGIIIVFIGIIFFIKRRFISKTFPNKTEELLNYISDIEDIGLIRYTDRYHGNYRNFPVSVFATTSMKSYEYYGGDQFHVWIATAPKKEQLKSIGGFFGKYLVSGEKDGFAYIGFNIRANSTNSNKDTIIQLINKLIDVLKSNQIEPFTPIESTKSHI